jgi:hypothetical protein
MPTDETPMPTDETTEAFQLLLMGVFQKIGSPHKLPVPSMEAIASAAASTRSQLIRSATRITPTIQ